MNEKIAHVIEWAIYFLALGALSLLAALILARVPIF
jgi:hypothetical protein